MNDLEKRVIEISYKKHLAHMGSALIALPIIKEIYEMKRPDEKFILSSGHAGLGLYVVLESLGGRNAEDVFDHHGVHPDVCEECRLDCSTGSLGHGLAIAAGMALADRSKRVFCLVSDGECMEGSTWEALRIIEEQKLDNLFIHFNFNGYGGYKRINIYDLYARLSSFRVNKKVHFTSIPAWPGLLAHYIILTKEQYEEIIRD
jgi:transketolase